MFSFVLFPQALEPSMNFNISVLLYYSQTKSSVPPKNEFIIQKLNPLLVVDFRLISAFLHV